MFKGKTAVQYLSPVTVSARLSYNLKLFPLSVYNSKRKYAFADYDADDDDTEIEGKENFAILPFGVSVDPVAELVLSCMWPEVAENVVIDSQTYTDFDPLLAPIWSLRARYERLPICYLSECLTEYLQQSECGRSLSDIIGESYTLGGTDYLEDVNPLERLTESKISTITSSVLPSLGSTSKTDPKKTHRNDGPLTDEQLMGMLYYMFPDAQVDSTHSYKMPNDDAVSVNKRAHAKDWKKTILMYL